MENLTGNKSFNAAIYVRLSKEDGDKVESDSIVNQKDLIRDYLKGMPDICVCSERADDGYSGVNFERPDFQKMMEDVRAGKINCVIVKDLSRFGRNFVEAGRYIDQIFPFLGVRFIAINDGYDSFCGKSSSDKILIPFKNLVNDAFCRDISVKIRSQLEIKRKKGDFIGSFAVYGYLKAPDDRHRLMVDEFASTVVQDIFKWKLQGISQQRIANRLNEMGILSPLEYKRSCGMNYKSGFQTNLQGKWTAVSVGRILRNEFYLGTLVQGKRSTPNHKIRTQVLKPQEDWIRIENSHEAIIAPEDFRVVNRLLLRDTRVAPAEETVYLFSGLIFCGDCRKNMVRNSVCQNGKTYTYYMCGSNRTSKECTAHRIREKTVEQAVFQSLKTHIENIINVERILHYINTLPFQQNEVKKIDAQLVKNREEIERCNLLKASLYESMISGIHSKTEYLEMKEMYEGRRKDALAAEVRLQKEIDAILGFQGDKCQWIERFKQYRDITELTRVIVVTLIDKILVHEGMRVDIHFKYQYDFDRMVETIGNVNRIQPIPMLLPTREAM
ncbi:recombinase family protein [Desulfosporosinus fructosivorans]